MNHPTRIATVLSLALAGSLLGPVLTASAHVSATASNQQAGASSVVTLSVPHGCDGSATTRVAVKIPEQINAVTPTRNAYYDLQKVPARLPVPTMDSHGRPVTERVDQVVWTARTPLPADQRDTFEMSLQLPADQAGRTLYFPTVQTCEQGQSAWVQIPAEGQDPHDLDLPAPSVTVTPASPASAPGAPAGHDGASQHGGQQADQHGQHHDGGSGEQAPQTAQGAAGGLTIAALVVGAVALVVSAAALVTARRRA